jgi:uncharacterized protein YaaQ
MKLIIAILRDTDSDPVTQALTALKFRVTRIASTGGLLRRGVATLLIGLENEHVESAIQVIRKNTTASEEGEKRATIFVVNVDRFVQF